jgi:ferredoxin
MVGCGTCGTVCPVEAISFPGRDLIWKVERERKIFSLVRKEATEKKAKLDATTARAAAEEAVAKLTIRAHGNRRRLWREALPRQNGGTG